MIGLYCFFSYNNSIKIRDMKKLFFTTLFTIIAVISSAQIINVQTFEFQQVTLSSDTTYSEPYPFIATYTFDLSQNTLTSFINNQSVTGKLIRYADLDDNTMVFVYADNPSAGWYVNTKTQSVSFFQMTLDGDIESRITKSIFIVY